MPDEGPSFESLLLLLTLGAVAQTVAALPLYFAFHPARLK
jgi:hypothetical protein